MENQVAECKLESKVDQFLPKGEIKVESTFYDGTACDFIMSVKAMQGSILEDMFRMFINYFALMKWEHKDVSEWAELRINSLRPMAIAISNELVKGYNPSLKEKLTGEEYLDHWVGLRFQFLLSHLDK
jgi:hypothetical protein